MNAKERKLVGLKMIGLAFAMLIVTGTMLYAQAIPIRFGLDNVESMTPGPPYASPWVFDGDDSGFITHDGSPFTYSMAGDYMWHYHAYQFFYSTDNPGIPAMDPTSSWCIEENLGFVDNINGFRVEFQQFALTGFQHANLVNPGAPWATAGEAGDIRTYTGGLGLIYQDKGDGMGEQLVLRVKDCVLRVQVHYPNAAQMQTQVPWWQDSIGSGLPTTVEGWGTVDTDNSAIAWAATFANPAVDNRIDFLMNTSDPVIQGNYGYYDFELGLQGSEHAIAQMVDEIPMGIFPLVVSYPQLDLELQFESALGGGPLQELNDLTVFYTMDNPQGNFPAQITGVLPRYWQFNTTLGEFNTAITFDLSGMDLGNSANWQIMRKGDLENDWQVWADFTILDANHIRANNVTAFSEWTVGTTEEETLPVVLSSFTATNSALGQVNIAWTTQSEANVHGYRVFRNFSDNYAEAQQVSSLIEGTNTSNQQHYTFLDTDVEALSSYYYWLQQMDLGGSSNLYGPIMITLSGDPENPETPGPELVTAIRGIFPNPGSFVTMDYALAKSSPVTVKVYNLRGQLVKHVYQGSQDKGIHYLQWDGRDDKGQHCPSGLYFFELSSGSREIERAKLLLIK